MATFTKAETMPLVITVDNGVVAHEAADFLAGTEIDLIITDHHQFAESLPKSIALVHSDQIAGSAVAWMLAKELSMDAAEKSLDLVAIGTVADMMPLQKRIELDYELCIGKQELIVARSSRRIR